MDSWIGCSRGALGASRLATVDVEPQSETDDDEPVLIQADGREEDGFVLLDANAAECFACDPDMEGLRRWQVSANKAAIRLGLKMGRVGKAGKQVKDAMMTAAYELAMDQDVYDPGSYMPLRYVVAMAAAGGLCYVGLRSKGPAAAHAVNFNTIIEEAEEHLNMGREGFTDAQASRVESLIAEARTRLRDYTSEEGANVNAVVSLVTPETAHPEQASGYHRDKQKVTFRDMTQKASQATRALNDQQALKERDPELAGILLALQAFRRFPCSIKKISEVEVGENFKANPAMGSRVFIGGLRKMAGYLAAVAHGPAREQGKRLTVVASGPGTGKTTSLSKMAQWAGQPMATLTGEAFCQMPIPAGKNAFDLVKHWIAKQVLQGFRVRRQGGGPNDTEPVINGIFLLDDFHLALEDKGPFARDPKARASFFQLCKNMADDNADCVIEVEVAPGIFLPVNLSRVHLVITVNRLPNEFGPSGDPALLSRIETMDQVYPDQEDRDAIAQRQLAPIMRVIAEAQHCDVKTLTWVNKKTASDCLREIAALDGQFADRYGGKLGIRGLSSLLKSYRQHVALKATAHLTHDPELFSFAGAIPFDLRAAAANIEDYRKAVDQNMAKAEGLKAALKKIEELRNQLGDLEKWQAEAVRALLATAQADFEKERGSDTAVTDAACRIQQYRRHVELNERQAVRAKFNEKFGYLRAASGADADGDVDRFGPVMQVMTEIYYRLVAMRKPHASPQNNKLVRVQLADPAADDATFYSNLADIIGKVPVYHLEGANSFLSDIDSAFGMELSDANYCRADNRGNYADYRLSQFREGHFKRVRVNNKHFFFARLPFKDCVGDMCLVPKRYEALEALINGVGVQTQINSGGFFLLRGVMNEEEEIGRRYGPQLTFIDNVLQNVPPEEVTGEAFIVAHIDAVTIEQIERWAALQTNPTKMPARVLFERHLHKVLNAVDFHLMTGRTIDPRSLTLFLIDDATQGSSSALSGDADIALTIVLGAPPIEGRATRAEYVLAETLEKTRQRANHQAELLDRTAFDAIVLDDTERAIFAQLTALDAHEARHAREHQVVLPTAVLDDCIRSFADRISARYVDVFDLASDALPTLAAFRAEWREFYDPHRRNIIAKIAEKERQLEQQAKEEAARIEHERREAVRCERAERRAERKEAERQKKKADAQAKAKAKAKGPKPSKGTASDAEAATDSSGQSDSDDPE